MIGAFTEARAREVMWHVLGDFMSVASRGLTARDVLHAWHEQIEYAVLEEAVDLFELQFNRPDATRLGLRYVVRDSPRASGRRPIAGTM